MNIDTIGTNAGSVWNALNEADALGLKQIKKITKLKDKELYAALGWLAREGKSSSPRAKTRKTLLFHLLNNEFISIINPYQEGD